MAALLLRGAYFGALKLALETALSKPRLGTILILDENGLTGIRSLSLLCNIS